MDFITCADAAQAAQRAAAHIAAALSRALAAQGQARLLVSGGKSPIPLFAALAQQPLPWAQVSIGLVDDRLLPPDHADSNAALVRAHLLQGPAAAARFTPLVDDPSDRAGCIARANAAWQSPTVALLGMGEDGHTASLFPGAPQLPAALDPAGREPYVAIDPPAAPYPRISASLPALLQAGERVLWLIGTNKRAVFDRAQQAVDPALPISLLLHQHRAPLTVFHAP